MIKRFAFLLLLAPALCAGEVTCDMPVGSGTAADVLALAGIKCPHPGIAAEPDDPADPIPDPDPEPPATGEFYLPSEPRASDPGALGQLDWYLTVPADDLNRWMYDRVQGLYEFALRNDNDLVRQVAMGDALEYMNPRHWSDGNYGFMWENADIPAIRYGDMKFTFASAVYYLKVVEGIEPTIDLEVLSKSFMRMGWHEMNWDRPWAQMSQLVTERTMGYSVMGQQYLARLGVDGALERFRKMVGYLESAQDDSGWWLHSYHGHDKDLSGPDMQIASPWMSAQIAGALYRGRHLDYRVDGILRKLAQAQLDALVPVSSMAGRSWSHPWNGTGYASRYFVCPGNPVRCDAVQRNDGWYSDLHLPEIWLTIRAGGMTAPFNIEDFFTPAMIGESRTGRLWAWQHSSFPD